MYLGSWVKTFLAFLLSSNYNDTTQGMLSSTTHGMGPGLWKVLGTHVLGSSRMGPEANPGQSLHPSVSDEVINEKAACRL